MKSIILKNCRLIDPATEFDAVSDILIEDGVIKETGLDIDNPNSEIIDLKNMIVTPGFIDPHVHLRDPGFEHKETIESGCNAAARGGFTTIASMPNTNPVNDNKIVTRYILSKASDMNGVKVIPMAAITKGEKGHELTNMVELKSEGAGGFTDDGACVMSAGLFLKALKKGEELNLPVMQHPEDHSISRSGIINEGKKSEELGLKGIPALSEDLIIERDIALAEASGTSVHLTHVSTKKAAQLIREARARGVKVTSDVTPHHLVLNEDVIKADTPLYKVKPPLRTEEDREAMVEAICDGTIDAIGTDHAPHAASEKTLPFESAAFGMTGLETAFQILYTALVESGRIPLIKLLKIMSLNPADILRLEDRGRIAPGLPADLVVIDPDKEYEIRESDFASKSANTPFPGFKGKGCVIMTFADGRQIYTSKD